MFISFAVTNFRSIHERQEISFIATKHEGLSDCLIPAPEIKSAVLPVLAIYGANAAGKTNLLRALFNFVNAIRKSFNSWKPNAKLPADPHFFYEDEPTRFEAIFVLKSRTYKYGFSYDRDSFLDESLTEGRKLLFRRKGRTFRFGDDLKGYESLKRSTRANALFLSVAAQSNHPLLGKIYQWFNNWDTITEERTTEEAMAGHMVQDETMRSFLADAISIIAPDIIGIEPGSVADTDLPPGMDPEMASLVKDHSSWIRTKFVHRSIDGSKTAVISLPEESKGTQSYFALAASILGVLSIGGGLILDEADQSLHPSLLRSIILLFQNRSSNPKRAQLIFNTHETTLLTPEVLRPDQVWFAERSPGGSSSFYCLADFEGVRSDTKAERAYLEGRFGAVPFLEDHTKHFANALRGASRAKNVQTSRT